jgi:hypothetical protein
MTLPSLNKVFVIKEANVTHIAQMTKIPIQYIQKINNIFPNDTLPLIKIFWLFTAGLHRENFIGYELDDSMDVFLSEETYEFNNKKLTAIALFALAFKNKQFKNEISSLKIPKSDEEQEELFNELTAKAEDVIEKQQAIDNKVEPDRLIRQKKEAIVTFQDGMFWHELKDGRDLDREGKIMHNSISDGGYPYDMIFSLKDKDGKPHIDIAINKEKNSINQLFRAANQDIELSDFNYVIELIKKLKTKHNLYYDKNGYVVSFKNAMKVLKQIGIEAK